MAAGGITAYTVHSPSGVLTLLGSHPTGGRAPTMAVLTPDGKFLLVPNSNFGNERGSVAVFAVDATNGTLTAVAGSPFSTGSATVPVSLAVHPQGTFVYTTNSSDGDISSVTAFQIDASTGFLTPVLGSPFSTQGAAATPGSIDPSGHFFFVSNGNSNSIQGFRIDPDSGALTTVPGSPFPTGLSPSAVSIDPSGKYLYCPNTRSNSVSAYAIDPATGTLRLINTLAAGRAPRAGEQVGLQ
jgi:YVTN family beta-propeller protein